MKITLLQRDLVWAAPSENFTRFEKAMSHHVDTDLFVLPEMFATGFCTHPEELPERSDRQTLAWMQRMAEDRGAAVAGSVAVSEDGHFFNRFYFVHPEGRVEHYDKRHLFTYGGEHEHFAPGHTRMVVHYQGCRILLQVCYDLRFPVWSRNLGDYDLIVYVASWPTSRIAVWNTLLRARAIENQCYVAGVNRVGSDPMCAYSGGTALIDAYGRTVAECQPDIEDALTAELDLEKLQAFRKKFPVLNDRDAFGWG